ncbi:hypothetical protein DFH29DRAFT_898410 [Suillus ampliporus]|nr:hypothetical protein DFH29DRAFT_898410 [Suillus ampliporus]
MCSIWTPTSQTRFLWLLRVMFSSPTLTLCHFDLQRSSYLPTCPGLMRPHGCYLSQFSFPRTGKTVAENRADLRACRRRTCQFIDKFSLVVSI